MPAPRAAVFLDAGNGSPLRATAGTSRAGCVELVGGGVEGLAGSDVTLKYLAQGLPIWARARIQPSVAGEPGVRATLTEQPKFMERRGALRVPVRAIARVSHDGEAGEFSAVTENVSVSGLLVRTDAPHSVGRELTLTFDIGTGPLTMTARVVRADRISDQVASWRLAMAFTAESPQLEAALVELLSFRGMVEGLA